MADSSGVVLDLTAKSGYTVASGKTLSGIGTVNVGSGNTLTVGSGANHAAGNSGTGVQSVTGNLTYSSGSIFEWDLTSSAHGTRGTTAGTATDYDGVNVSGALAGDAGTGAIFRVVLDSGTFTQGFWDADQSWDNIFQNSLGTSD